MGNVKFGFNWKNLSIRLSLIVLVSVTFAILSLVGTPKFGGIPPNLVVTPPNLGLTALIFLNFSRFLIAF